MDDHNVTSFVFYLRKLEAEWRRLSEMGGEKLGFGIAANDLSDLLFEHDCPSLCQLCQDDFSTDGIGGLCPSCMATVGVLSPGGDA